MVIELKQQLRLTQQLVMTPQLQQAIKLLQLNRLELVGLVQQELEENPVLEEFGDVDEEEVSSHSEDSDGTEAGIDAQDVSGDDGRSEEHTSELQSR